MLDKKRSLRLRYDLSSATEPDDPDDRSGFITIYAWCPARGEGKYDGVSITTNGYGRGRFVERADGNWHQTAGTCQYHLPATEDGMRRELRRLYLEVDEARTEEEEQRQWETSPEGQVLLAKYEADYEERWSL